MRRSAVVCVIAVALMLGLAISPARSQAAVSSPCPGDQGDPTTSGWALSTTTFDNAYTRHAYVGNGYLSQRVPADRHGLCRDDARRPAGRCSRTPTTARSSRACTATEPDPLIPPHDATIAAIPTWSTLKVGDGPGHLLGDDAREPDLELPPDALPALRRLAHVADVDPARRPRHGPRLRRDRRARSPARGRGEADDDPAVERPGHGHRRDRRRRRPPGHPDRRRGGRGRARPSTSPSAPTTGTAGRSPRR